MSETTAEPVSSEPASPKGYGTFEGVFVPTAVTILGVVMFLREGWVIGNAGFGGGVLIILLAFTITGTTALSLSSVTTNIRIGAGGAYSVISTTSAACPTGNSAPIRSTAACTSRAHGPDVRG